MQTRTRTNLTVPTTTTMTVRFSGPSKGQTCGKGKWCPACSERLQDGRCPVCTAKPKATLNTPATRVRPTAARPPKPATSEACFIGEARRVAAAEGLNMAEALGKVARVKPELYRAHVDQARELAVLRREHKVLTSIRDGQKRTSGK